MSKNRYKTNNKEEITHSTPGSIGFSSRDFADHIVNTLNHQVTIDKKIHRIYKKTPQLIMAMENFCNTEEQTLKQNTKRIHDKKMSLQELHNILDNFLYERNDLEEIFLNIDKKLELAIDQIGDNEEKEAQWQKLDEFRELFNKIYKNTDRVYKTYEYFARNFYRLTTT